MRIRAFALLILLVGMAACSSPPKVTQAPAKSSADVTLRLAQNLEQKHRILDSRQTYESALKQYRSFGDVPGELSALSGLARLAYLEGNLSDYETRHVQMSYLVKNAAPGYGYILLLLDLYRMQQEGDYVSLEKAAQDSYDYPIHVRMQILSYKLQAESYLRPGFSGKTYTDLQRLAGKYRKSLKSDFSADPSVLSSALYAMAYHQYLNQNYSLANDHIDEVVSLDMLHENFIGLGYAHWLRGMIHEANQDKRQALADYVRAETIFSEFGIDDMVAKTQIALSRLQGEGQ